MGRGQGTALVCVCVCVCVCAPDRVHTSKNAHFYINRELNLD